MLLRDGNRAVRKQFSEESDWKKKKQLEGGDGE